MIRTSVGVALSLVCASCGTASESTGVPGGGSSASPAQNGDAGGPSSAGTVGCDDGRSRPDASCGRLGWATSTATVRPRNHHLTLTATTDKGRFLYALGGFDTRKTTLRSVDRIAIGDDGAVGTSVAEPDLPMPVGGFTGGVVSGVLVIAGGMSASAIVDKTYSAVVGKDGALAPWKSGPPLAHARFHAGGFVDADALYVLGGFDAGHVWSDVLRAKVTSDGAVSPWTSAGSLPGPRSHFSVSLVDGYVYLAGGLDKREETSFVPALRDVSRGRLDPDGSVVEWTDMPPLPVGLATHTSFFYGGYLYVAGGISGVDALKEEKRVWRAPVQDDHALGSWESVTPLPRARGHVHQMPIVGGRVYSLGGALDLDLDSSDAVDIGSFR